MPSARFSFASSGSLQNRPEISDDGRVAFVHGRTYGKSPVVKYNENESATFVRASRIGRSSRVDISIRQKARHEAGHTSRVSIYR